MSFSTCVILKIRHHEGHTKYDMLKNRDHAEMKLLMSAGFQVRFRQAFEEGVRRTPFIMNHLPVCGASWSFLYHHMAPATLASVLSHPPEPRRSWKNRVFRGLRAVMRTFVFLSFVFLFFDFLSSFLFPGFFQPLLFHLSVLSEVWIETSFDDYKFNYT